LLYVTAKRGEAMTTPIEEILGRAESAGDAAAQADLLVEAASLYEATAEYDRAFLVRATAYRLRPTAKERAGLQRLVARIDRWVELESMLAEVIPSLAADERTAATLLHADALAALGRTRDVEPLLRAIVDGAADDGDRHHARLRLEKLARERGDARALLALLDERAALEPDDLAALREAATLAESVDGAAAAAERWTALRERLPGDPAPLRALDGLYARLGRVRDRTEVLEALIGLSDSVRARAELQRALAAAWSELGERGRAIESLEWLLEYEPDETTWRALADHYRAEGRFAAYADECTRHIETVAPRERAGLWRELAAVYARDLGDPGQAIKCWKAVLADENDAVDALQALVPLYEAIDACDRAVDCLERWAALASDGKTRAHRLLRAAELCASRPDLVDRTSELLERALDADEQSVPIRVALVAHLRQRGEVQRAARLIDAAVRAPNVHVALVAQAAALLEAEGDLEGAFAQLRALVERIPGHVDARWHACVIGQELGHHADVLELVAALPAARAETAIERWLLVARSARATGDKALAAESLDRAVALAPDRADVQRLQAERLLADGDIDGAERCVESLAAASMSAPAADRAAVAFLAGQCAHARHHASAALVCYRTAVALDPAHRAAQRAILDDAVELKRWHEALAALDALVRLESDPSLRARYRHLSGHILEEELGRAGDALVHYQAALVDDPDHPRSCERIATLLRNAGDFAALAAHCAKALERMGNGGDVARRAFLWNELAAAAAGLGDRDGATAALEVVVRLDGSHWDARRTLAGYYVEAGADARDQAIAAQHELLRLDKLHVPAYRTLAKLYYDGGATQRGLACEQAARLLSARDPARARDNLPPTPPPMRTMAPADWSRLRHPDEDRFVSALSVIVAPLLAASSAVALDGRTRPGEPLSGDGAPRMTEAVRWAARTLDVFVPELFTRNDLVAPVRFVNGRVGRSLKPALLIGLPLLGDRRRLGELLPPLTLQMALLRPERMLRLLVADAEMLTTLLRATVSVACNEPPSGELAVTAAALRHSLPPLALDQLGVIGRRLRDEGRDLSRVAAAWLRGADLTAARAALVLSNDLPRTLAAVEGCAFDPAGLRHALGELVWVSVTDEVWVTRQRLVEDAHAAPSEAQSQKRS
jgi:lipopolysaccharide biosynthesis regulator YciM